MKVRWTDEAFARLAEIEDFVARDNAAAAARLVARIVARGEALAAFPRRGRKLSEHPGLDLRELVEGNYRIVYRVQDAVVEVLTVFEGHRLPPPMT